MKYLFKPIRIFAVCAAMIGLLGLLSLPSTATTAVNEALSLRVRGDVDQNGSINTTDARKILQHVAGLTISSFSAAAADYNNDGNVNTTDARLTLQFAAGCATIFPHPINEGKQVWEPLQGTTIPVRIVDTAEIKANFSKEIAPVLVAQTPTEWALLQQLYTMNVTYDEAFFADQALILVDVFLSTTNSTMTLNGAAVSNGILQVTGTHRRPTLDTDSRAHVFALLEVPHSVLNGVTAAELYLERVVVDR